jgi:hypothetical protein
MGLSGSGLSEMEGTKKKTDLGSVFQWILFFFCKPL